MKRLTKNLLMTALLLSFFLHFGAGVVVYLKNVKPRVDDSIEVQIVDAKKMAEFERMKANNAKQIVEQSEKPVNDEIDEKAKYLSRFNQKVVTETKAQNNGKFQNDAKMGEAPKTEKQQAHQEQKHEKNEKQTVDRRKSGIEDGEVPLPKLSLLKPQFHWDQVQVGVKDPGKQSQTDDYLKDTATGPQTLLSSREFIYYSYYSRIKERLRMFWEPKIKEKVTRLFMSGRHIASNEEKITRLVITLDASGKLIRVQVLGESGLKDLDDAAIEAFQAAAPFPNPPKGIVESDGTIKIRWDFILEAGDIRFTRAEKVYARR